MEQRIIDLYDSFTHGFMSRRDFMDRLTEVAGSTAAAVAILPLLQNNYAMAQMVPENDARLVADTVSYDAPGGKVSGYLVRPKDKSKRPGIIVIHENRGLNPHIKDVARRLATEGYLVYALDLLSTSGSTPTDEDKARDMFAKLNLDETEKETVAGIAFLKQHAESNGKVGAVGFCWGGAMINRIAAGSPDLDVAVAYYGRQIPADRVPSIKAPLLMHYAENDQGVNSGIAAYKEALEKNNKKFTQYTYPGTQHAFNNDTGGARYNKEQADIAWGRTLTFFKENLGAPPKAS